MVEAAVVVMVLVVFWGVLAMAFTAGKAKLIAQFESRIGVMYYASNNCKKKLVLPDAVVAPNANAGTFDGSGDYAADHYADRAPLGDDSTSARSSFFFATVDTTASATLVGRTSTAKSTSWAVCNESPYDGDLPGLFKYAYNLFKGMLPAPLKAITP
jgi:hypothetical protein